jgi:hypothetical protein
MRSQVEENHEGSVGRGASMTRGTVDISKSSRLYLIRAIDTVTLDVLVQVIAGTPVISAVELRPGLPKPLGDLCRTCLAKAPEERYRTMQDLRLALSRLIS